MDEANENINVEQTPEAVAQTAQQEAPQETPVEERKPRRFDKYLADEYPDRNFDADEDYENGVGDMMDSLVSFRDKTRQADKKFAEVLEANPDLGMVIRDMMDGASLTEALARHIDPADLTPAEGDPDYEGWERNRNERLQRAEDRKKRQEQFDANLEISAKNIREFAEENNMTTEEAAKWLEPFDKLLGEINNGTLSKETLLKIKRITDYDKDIENARNEGLLKGRNENITAQKQAVPKGDGLPHPKGKGAPVDETERLNDMQKWFGGLVDSANKNRVL